MIDIVDAMTRFVAQPTQDIRVQNCKKRKIDANSEILLYLTGAYICDECIERRSLQCDFCDRRGRNCMTFQPNSGKFTGIPTHLIIVFEKPILKVSFEKNSKKCSRPKSTIKS